MALCCVVQCGQSGPGLEPELDCALSTDSWRILQLWMDGALNIKKNMAQMEILCAASEVGSTAGTLVGSVAGASAGSSGFGWAFRKGCTEMGGDSSKCELAEGIGKFIGSLLGAAVGGEAGGQAGSFVAKSFVEVILPDLQEEFEESTDSRGSFKFAVEECKVFMGISDNYDQLTQNGLKRRFRKLAMIHHPDKSTGSQQMFLRLVTCDGMIKVSKGWTRDR